MLFKYDYKYVVFITYNSNEKDFMLLSLSSLSSSVTTYNIMFLIMVSRMHVVINVNLTYF